MQAPSSLTSICGLSSRMAMLSSAVPGEAASTQAATQACHTTALTLLLRLLPFKQPSSKDSTGKLLQHNRNALLEELHKHPLWRYSSLDERSAYQTPPRIVVPQETHDALLDFVKLAAEAEDVQRPGAMHKCRRDGPVTAADVAAELHAVYALAAAHAATEQQQQRKDGRPSLNKQLTSTELLALLSAYSSLSDSANSASSNGKSYQQLIGQNSSSTADWQGDAAAAAVQAIYAFAALADTAAQHQPQHKAPGQLHSRPATTPTDKCAVGAEKQGCHSCSGAASGTASYQISSSDAKQQELEVLLQLARLAVPS